MLPADPFESAKIAGLKYVSDAMPGITRRKSGSGFIYITPQGAILRDPDELSRIRSLVLPPAWANVWICPLKTGHLQAVGVDARGRKQYRYHPLYRRVRDATKFTRMAAFGQVLPRIRERVDHDLRRPGLPKEKVLATLVRLLEATSIRIGNEEYRKQNESFGLTTLRNRHVQIAGRTLRFHFKGKSGQIHDVELTDRRLAGIVARCHDIPGHELFQYVDDEGDPAPITSGDVNDYLHEIAGNGFTAKDFRTWNGSNKAALALESMGPADSEAMAKKNIVEAVKATSIRLGNRPAACRKYYIHPAVFDAYTDGTLFDFMKKARARGGTYGLSRSEVAVLQMVAAHIPKPVRAAPGDHEVEAVLRKSVARAKASVAQIAPSSSVESRA